MYVNNPRLKVLIQNKDALDEFETRCFLLIEDVIICSDDLRYNLTHLGDCLTEKIVLTSVKIIQILLECFKIYLVSRFILSEISVFCLDTISDEMAKLVIQIHDIKLLAS